MKRVQRGHVMVEWMLWIAIVLIAGGLGYGAMMYVQSRQASTESDALKKAVATLQSKFARAPNTAGMTTLAAIAGRVFDPGYFSSDVASGMVQNQFGGEVSVRGINVVQGGVNDGFMIEDRAIPNGICGQMIPLLSEATYRIDVNGVSRLQASPGVSPARAAIDAACESGADGLSVIRIYFLRRQVGV